MIFKSAKYRIYSFIACFVMLFASTACHKGKMEDDVLAFSNYYFNWQFEKALPYTTADSHKWMSYAASQVHQADIDILRKQEEGAKCELGDIEYIEDTAYVMVNVHNFLGMDTIGTEGHMIDDATYRLKVILQGENWKVKLDGLPRMNKVE